ncbi:SDR family oxidoreductase [Noviherbaspirillum aridicola]|uniref:Glucose 1-dehydrogenase n=1 Tax=Noviherbaspirillum aridicola TaxID=2849687 RepID=A0ABQ4Q9Q6_9BURK|nr:SDR family oxidoreductase [Noviherbaspirillum aridicola]GIZ53958.1 glucose 1-dehydrogenase [Noviherbaspirillum aridicola]
MKPRLKKLHDQVVVITGASSGIGLTTARMAAARGARLVLAARNEDALRQLAAEIESRGGQALAVVADVGSEDDMRRVAAAAVERFGGFDTWINNAGVSIFGRLEEVSSEDHRQLFQTNFWGVVHGSLVAAEHLRRQGGGAIINLGSEVSDRAVPLQGMYAASKHAVKGFTDALRMELEEEGLPISVTLIKPAAIDTMFVAHARNYLEVEPQLPPPIYAPDVAADAILHAAEHPVRDLFVGSGAKAVSAASHYAPRLVDRVMERFMFSQQKSSQPPGDRSRHSLYKPGVGLQERQGDPRMVREHSVYTAAVKRPGTALTAAAGLGLLTWMFLRGRGTGTRAVATQSV